MKWFWIAAFVLLAIAAASVWFAFQRPDFVAGLTAAAVAAAWKAFAPKLLKRMPPEKKKAWRERQKRAQMGRQDR
jgi:hypothetical protein